MAARHLTPALAVQLANPRSWVASLYPTLFGLAYGTSQGYGVTLAMAFALVVAAIAMQSAVNTLNDYYDFVKGTDSIADHVEVRDAAMVYGTFPLRQAFYLGIAFLAVAAIIAVPVCIAAGPAPLLIGAFGTAIVWMYSGGILPISYLPLGEVVSGVVMGGLIPLGVVAAMSGGYSWAVLVPALPFVLGIGLIMMTNNTCDIEKDRRARRHTLPVRLGRQQARGLYRIVTILWFVTMGCIASTYIGWLGWLIPLVAVVVIWKGLAHMMRTKLCPERRVGNMKAVVMVNVLGNGIYLAWWIWLAGGMLHG